MKINVVNLALTEAESLSHFDADSPAIRLSFLLHTQFKCLILDFYQHFEVIQYVLWKNVV